MVAAEEKVQLSLLLASTKVIFIFSKGSSPQQIQHFYGFNFSCLALSQEGTCPVYDSIGGIIYRQFTWSLHIQSHQHYQGLWTWKRMQIPSCSNLFTPHQWHWRIWLVEPWAARSRFTVDKMQDTSTTFFFDRHRHAACANFSPFLEILEGQTSSLEYFIIDLGQTSANFFPCHQDLPKCSSTALCK